MSICACSTLYVHHVSAPPPPPTDCGANRCQVTPPQGVGGWGAVIGLRLGVLSDIFSHLQMIGSAHVHPLGE